MAKGGLNHMGQGVPKKKNGKGIKSVKKKGQFCFPRELLFEGRSKDKGKRRRKTGQRNVKKTAVFQGSLVGGPSSRRAGGE